MTHVIDLEITRTNIMRQVADAAAPNFRSDWNKKDKGDCCAEIVDYVAIALILGDMLQLQQIMSRPSSSGFTLFEVILATTLVTLALSAASFVFIQNIRAQIKVLQLNTTLALKDGFEAWLAQNLGPFFDGLTPADCDVLPDKLHAALLENQNVDEGYDKWVWADPASSEPFAQLDTTPSSDERRADAVERCQTQQTPKLAVAWGDETSLYFCLRYFHMEEMGSRGYFARPTFVEVHYAFRDFQTNDPLTCKTATSQNLRGGAIHYELYSECDGGSVKSGCIGGNEGAVSHGNFLFQGVVYALMEDYPAL